MGRLALCLIAAAATCSAQELPLPMKRAVESLSRRLLKNGPKEPTLIAEKSEPSKT